MRAPIRPAFALALLAVTAAGLSGCGRKGALESPTAAASKPATSPALVPGAAADADAKPAPKTVQTPGGTTIVPSKEPSILDAIL